RSDSMSVLELGRFFNQFTNRPDVVFQTAGHRWRFLERHVLATEVVVREPKPQRGFVILPPLTKSVRHSRESTGCNPLLTLLQLLPNTTNILHNTHMELLSLGSVL